MAETVFSVKLAHKHLMLVVQTLLLFATHVAGDGTLEAEGAVIFTPTSSSEIFTFGVLVPARCTSLEVGSFCNGGVVPTASPWRQGSVMAVNLGITFAASTARDFASLSDNNVVIAHRVELKAPGKGVLARFPFRCVYTIVNCIDVEIPSFILRRPTYVSNACQNAEQYHHLKHIGSGHPFS